MCEREKYRARIGNRIPNFSLISERERETRLLFLLSWLVGFPGVRYLASVSQEIRAAGRIMSNLFLFDFRKSRLRLPSNAERHARNCKGVRTFYDYRRRISSHKGAHTLTHTYTPTYTHTCAFSFSILRGPEQGR